MSAQHIDSIGEIAWKGVSRKIFRNIVLVLAVGLLVALLVFAMLFNKAVREDIDEATRKLGADIVLVPVEAKDMAEEFILESKEKTFYMDPFVYESIEDLEGIKAINYHIYLDTLESGCCSITEGQVVAFDSENDFVISPWLENYDHYPLKQGEVYVGSYVWEYLGLINTATLFGKGVKVVGHLKETGTGLDHGIFMRVKDLDKISDDVFTSTYKKGEMSIIFIKLEEGVDIDEMTSKIQSINPMVGIMTRGTIGADVRSTLKDILKVFSITILISSLLAVSLAWSTFTALANERMREVGILRAIGAKKSHIIKIFLSEAVIISGLGGVAGIFIGHILIKYLSGDFHLLTRLGAIATISMHNALISLLAMLIGVGVCLIGALIPVVRLAEMEPLSAIKED